jgi:putative ABC transport system permease protein
MIMFHLTSELKAWWRSEARQPLVFTLKILGFLIGFVGAILLLGYVNFESSYDSWNPNADRLVRAVEVRSADGAKSVELPYPFAQAAEDSIPQIKAATRVQSVRVMIQHGADKFNEVIYFVDPSFSTMFDIKYLSGTAPLSRPFSVVLSESAARKYFGRTDVVGQTLLLGGERPITVTAVMHDWPVKSHLHPDFLLPLESFFQMIQEKANVPRDAVTRWNNCHCYDTYMLLDKPSDFGRVNGQMNNLLIRSQGQKYATEHPVSLQRMTDAYLGSEHIASYLDHARKGDPTQLTILSGIAFILLLTSAINFANFSMAQSTLRAREVAIRRVLGASRAAIARRLLAEAFAMSFVALLVSYGIALLAAERVGAFLERDLHASDFLQPTAIAEMLVAAALTSLVAGAFAAATLSQTQPALLLRSGIGAQSRTFSTSHVRQALVLAQFLLSSALIISAIGMYEQIYYIQTQPKGYFADNKIIVNAEGSHQAFEELKSKIATVPGVSSVSIANSVPTTSVSKRQIIRQGGDPAAYQEIAINECDFNYLNALGDKIVAGRGFSQTFGGDRFALPEKPLEKLEFNVVINESAARRLGFAHPADSIGQVLEYADDRDAAYTMRVAGVAQDIRYGGPHDPVVPMIHLARDDWGVNHHETRYFLVSTARPGDVSSVPEIAAIWNATVPGFVSEVTPLPDALKQQLVNENKQFQLVAVFGVAGVLVSMLGVLGLAAFMMERRAKEFAVRRVLGATRESIALLVTRSQLTIVILATLLSFPLAFWGLSHWLTNFDVRVDISPFWFLGGGAASVITAAVVLYGFTYRITSQSPAQFLKAE